MLLLIPTPFELSLLDPSWIDRWKDCGIQIELSGFGQILAAARTASLIERLQPKHVLLLGIAGSLKSDIEVGTAICFSQVICHGIGIGQGQQFNSASKSGWPQWHGPPVIEDSIELSSSDFKSLSNGPRQLLSCCSASSNFEDAYYRSQHYPMAIAEDMEGFGVASACLLRSIPVTIIRGISNRAGDRDKRNWQCAKAISAAAEVAEQEGLL